jgi:hypothetical protein
MEQLVEDEFDAVSLVDQVVAFTPLDVLLDAPLDVQEVVLVEHRVLDQSEGVQFQQQHLQILLHQLLLQRAWFRRARLNYLLVHFGGSVDCLEEDEEVVAFDGAIGLDEVGFLLEDFELLVHVVDAGDNEGRALTH